jgi:phosphate-selective porin
MPIRIDEPRFLLNNQQEDSPLKIKSTSLLIAGALMGATALPVHASNDAMLDLLKVLRDRGTITSEDYDLLAATQQQVEANVLKNTTAATATEVDEIVERKVSEAIDLKLDESFDARVEETVTAQVAKKVDEFPVKVSHGKKGFRFESRDGNWQTNLQWRAQMRYTTPDRSDPRQLDDFEDDRQNSFENRRLRMKIGGHAYRPWLGYYFELDLQPTRDTGDSGSDASTRVIDWRITLDKYKALALRLGQWKVDYNRERVDSSGRQQFVERSIVNRTFTIDRQVGAQLRGHLFEGTPADMRYYAGVFTGEGRGVRNDDKDLMYMGRLQWNVFGRDLAWKQTDVEYTEKPTGSLSLSAASNTGRCTRWSSSGCGNLDGFQKASAAQDGQYEVDQWTQGAAFKWKGFSFQEEYHRKTVDDTVNNTSSDWTGAYVQSGYFLHHLIPAIPKQLELAARYAFVEEPNENNIQLENKREEFTIAANWFIAGHNNKITADYSYLTLDDDLENRDVGDSRVRLQWDVSF